MAPRPDVSEERRLQIVDAAARVFTRKGYHSATMPEIAQMAGLSVGGMYWYYKSKEELVRAIMEQCFQQDAEALRALAEADAPIREAIQRFASSYIEGFTRLQWINSLGIEFYSQAPYDPEIRAFVEVYLGRYRDALAALLARGIERGEIRPVNPVDAANVFIGLEEGLALLVSADPRHLSWRETFQLGIDLLTAGLSIPSEQ